MIYALNIIIQNALKLPELLLKCLQFHIKDFRIIAIRSYLVGMAIKLNRYITVLRCGIVIVSGEEEC